jgi:hypothetical protein
LNDALGEHHPEIEQKEDNYFLLSPPCDSEAFRICLSEVNAQYPRGIISRYTEHTEPAPEYYFNQVQSMNDFHKLINHVVDSEDGIIKLTYGFVTIIENESNGNYEYSTRTARETKKYSVPITLNLIAHRQAQRHNEQRETTHQGTHSDEIDQNGFHAESKPPCGA